MTEFILPYDVISLPNGHGNGLIANRKIFGGELIFQDQPHLWYIKNNASNSCLLCGISISPSTHHESSSNYCSQKCILKARVRGHCWSQCPQNKGYVQELTENDALGHLGLALSTYCQIAQAYVDQNLDKDEIVRTLPSVIGEELLRGYFHVNYLKSLHACRVEHFGINDSIFESMISPTYYASYLAHPLELIKQILSDMSCWCVSYNDSLSHNNNYHSSLNTMNNLDSNNSHSNLQLQQLPENLEPQNQSERQSNNDYIKYLSETFLTSEIFSESFFIKLMGVYIVNNIQMQYSYVADNSASTTTATTTTTPTTTTNSTIPTTTSPTTTLINDSVSGTYDTRLGTGLFSTYSKMNHSCVCNTYNIMNTNIYSSTENTIGVISVYASGVIQKGEEITTSYLHNVGGDGHNDGDVIRTDMTTQNGTTSTTTTSTDSVNTSSKRSTTSSLSLEDRQKGLLQYLFTCSCPLCTEQILDTESSLNPTSDY